MMDTCNFVFYCAAATGVTALPFLLISWLKYVTRAQSRSNGDGGRITVRFPIKSTIFFIVPMLIGITVARFMAAAAREDALKFVRELSGHYSVCVNERPVADADRIISVLKTITPYWAHHSHPTKRIRVGVYTDRGNLILELRRDSGNPQEYWVFQPEYGVTSNNEIGRITSSVFDEY